MPLRALADDRDLVAPLLSDEEWTELRDAVRAKALEVRLPCCDTSAFPRVSKLGTRHFVHRRARGCPGSGETFQHLWLKAEVLRACAAAGWDARPEVAGEGWRADVLATRGASRVAFEVQWSPQEDEAFEARQARYAAAGVRACWLHRGDTRLPETRDIPVFRLVPHTSDVATIEAAGRTYGVREFVGLLLSGGVRFTPSATSHVRVSFLFFPCWKCHRRAHIFYAQSRRRCCPADDGLNPYDRVDEFHPEILARVQAWLAYGRRRERIRLGTIKRRWSNTVKRRYMSFGCPDCDALFGDYFVGDAILNAMIGEAADASFAFLSTSSGGAGHWCVPPTGVAFCGTEVSRKPRNASASAA